jgi:hypothetical protein
MKGRDLQKFVERHLLPSLSGFAFGRRVIYAIPIEHVLCGLLFDSSGFSAETFYPHAFVQPLYVPSEHLVLSFGDRLPGVWKFAVGREQELADRLVQNIRKQFMPSVASLRTPELFAKNASRFSWFRKSNPHLAQAMAYSLAFSGEWKAAAKWLRTVEEIIQKSKMKYEWEVALAGECRRFQDLLAGDPEGAQRQLAAWSEQTRNCLKLPSAPGG